MNRTKVVLVALNKPNNYALALGYLKLYAQTDPELNSRLTFSELQLSADTRTFSVAVRIAAQRPGIVGFSCNVWNIHRILKVVKHLRRFCPSVPIIFGGQEVTNSQIDYMGRCPQVDVLVDGEGEETFRRVLRSIVLADGGSLAEIPGIQYRADGQVQTTPRAEAIAELNLIPSPYLADLIEVLPDAHLGVMIETARGCRFRCTFCFEGSRFKKIRYFPMERVEAEIAHMAAKGAHDFHILDPILANADRERLTEMNRIIEQHILPHGRHTLSVEVHAELLKADTIHLLKHFTLFDVGLQSVNAVAMKHIRRPVNWDRFLNGVELLRTLPGRTNLYVLEGLPGENFFLFLRSVRFVFDLDVPRLFLNRLCVLNGTELSTDAAGLKLRHSETPPYIAMSNYSFSEHEVQLGDIFGKTLMREHGATVLPSVLWRDDDDCV